jgi:hypothetical protein
MAAYIFSLFCIHLPQLYSPSPYLPTCQRHKDTVKSYQLYHNPAANPSLEIHLVSNINILLTGILPRPIPAKTQINDAQTFSGERNPERLRAEYAQLCELKQRRVDGQRQLDRQLRRHHRRQDEGALQEQLVAVAIGVLGTWQRVAFKARRLKWCSHWPIRST